MRKVTRKIPKTSQMSITSLIDILTILLLFVMVNVSSDSDTIPEDIILEKAIFEEQIAENSKIISLNISYTGRDEGMVTYRQENSINQIPIASLKELNTTTKEIISAKTIALDRTIYSILGDDIGDTPVVVRVRAHRDTPFKYVNSIKSMLIDIWNDESSYVSSKVKSRNFKLYFATDFVKDESIDYYRLLSAYGLGGSHE